MEPSNVKVTAISTEMIKPASPTPSHLRKFTLSLLDQKYSPMIVPAVLFYKRPQGAASLDISHFKTCLSQTLTAFYPLAGRVESESTILCNDEGIPFVEACVDCELSSVVESLSSKNADYLRCFYPPREGLIDAGIHFAFQVSVFSCGGFGFALYATHKITDATSSSFFFGYWAALVAQRSEYAAQYLADFNSAVRVFPPVLPQEEIPVTPPILKEEIPVTPLVHEEIPVTPPVLQEEIPVTPLDLVHEEIPVTPSVLVQEEIPVTPPIVPQEEIPVTSVLNHEKQGDKQEKEEKKDSSSSSSRFVFQNHIVVRSFVIKNEAAAELKARSISEEVPNPSRFEAIAGFLWKSILSSNSAMEGRSMLNVAVNLRSRVDPPLPADSIGNIFETALVKSEKNADLPELVAKIRKSISKIKDLATEYQGEKREEAKDAHWKEFINSVIECKGKDAYVITPWYNSAGFADLDFGFGNPKRIVPIDDVANHNQRNTIILSDFLDPNGNGFEAWMFLEEECIKFLESSKEFLAIASPNF